MHQTFERRIEVAVPAERAWPTVTDVRRLVSWIPILHSARELEPLSIYTVTLEDRLGPFRLRADLDVTVTGSTAPHDITVRAEGEDRQVGSRVSVAVTLMLNETGPATTVTVTGEYEVTGKAASLGASSIRKKANTILDEFCGRVTAELGSAPTTS
jgi:carbon monoxide dehydrogenase subunit G